MINKKISRLCAQFFNARFAPDVQAAINEAYAAHFALDLSDFRPAREYASLQELFTRRLERPREIAAEGALICPCDGTLLSFGRSEAGQAMSIKNRHYEITELLGADWAQDAGDGTGAAESGDKPAAAGEFSSAGEVSAANDDAAKSSDCVFENAQNATGVAKRSAEKWGVAKSGDRSGEKMTSADGAPYKTGLAESGDKPAANFDFINIYLSPRDYHHYHAPCAMRVRSARYVAAKLRPVNLRSLRAHENLYATNERVILRCDGAFGEFFMVFVGALNVGRMNFAFDASIKTNAHLGSFTRAYSGVELARGEHLGNFELGSTILLIGKNLPALAPGLAEGSALRFGQKLSE